MKSQRFFRFHKPTALMLLVLPAAFLLSGCLVGYVFPDNAQGWQLDGAYCGASKQVITPLAGAAAWFDEEDALSQPQQDPLGNQRGAIGFPMLGLPNCNCQFWRIDVISPDVSGSSNWQNLQGFQASLLDHASMQGVVPVSAQLMFLINKQTDTYLIENDASGQPVFCALPIGSWVTCAAKIDTTGYTVLNVVVRVFGACASPTSGAFEGGIFVDSVLPNKQPTTPTP